MNLPIYNNEIEKKRKKQNIDKLLSKHLMILANTEIKRSKNILLDEKSETYYNDD